LSSLLFICSKNQWRSPTAELLFKDSEHHVARSAGTSDKARTRISQKIVDWADILFFMERKHKEMVTFRFDVTGKVLIILDIEDDYPFGDEELIIILRASLADYL
jgi:predicted protein tyrosine phosphatase